MDKTVLKEGKTPNFTSGESDLYYSCQSSTIDPSACLLLICYTKIDLITPLVPELRRILLLLVITLLFTEFRRLWRLIDLQEKIGIQVHQRISRMASDHRTMSRDAVWIIIDIVVGKSPRYLVI